MAVDVINSLMVNFLVYSRRVLGVFESAIDEAKRTGEERIAVATLPIMGAFPELGVIRQASAIAPVFYVNDPIKNVELLSVGAEKMREFHGEDAIAKARTAFMEYLSIQSGDELVSPLFYGGFAFAPGNARSGVWQKWPDGLWVWPRWQWVKEGGRVNLIVSHLVNADSNAEDMFRDLQADLQKMALDQPPLQAVAAHSMQVAIEESTDANAWMRAVEDTVHDIKQGKYEKVVLARKLTLKADHDLDAIIGLAKLKSANPTNVSFYLAYADDVFVGSTPERLVETRNNQVAIDCLAGTAPRGQTDAEDDVVGKRLLESTKDLYEHRLVRTGILESVEGVAKVSAPNVPMLRKLTHVQHLYTPIRGELNQGKTLFDLVESLHPTPAVSGLPNELAKEAILEREGMDRGFYAGPIGWMDRDGNGTFVVALRSGLIHANKATLFAGAGIVSDSNAEAEWQETEWKFTPMKASLSIEPK